MKTQKFTDIVDGYVIEIRSYKKYDNHYYPADPVYKLSRWQLLQQSIYVPSPKKQEVITLG